MKDFNKRTRKYAPSIDVQRRKHTEMVMSGTERELKLKNPPEKKYGARSRFLEKYKIEGYEKAKKAINAGFNGREVFNDETIIGWFGFKQNIFDAYNKGTIEDAYKKADEINKKIGYPLLKKENIDMWIAEETEKENQNNKDENNDAR